MNNQEVSFWDHVEDLRSTLIRVLATVFSATILALIFHQEILNLLINPLENEKVRIEEVSFIKVVNSTNVPIHYTLPASAKLTSRTEIPSSQTIEIPPFESIYYDYPKPKLALFSPVEGLTTILKVCFWIGTVISSPVWLFWIYLFIAPALHEKEKKGFIPFALCSLVFSSIGLAFCYYSTIPLANHYLSSLNAQIGSNIWGLSHYLNYTLILLIGNALAFELCVILFFLIRSGRITDAGMRKYRPFAVIAIFVLSAILTPPDVFTQLMLAVPLLGFYELGILYAKIKNKRLVSEISNALHHKKKRQEIWTIHHL